MTQRQLNHFLDLRQLLATTADVIVSDSVQRFFFFLPNENNFDYSGSMVSDKGRLTSRLMGSPSQWMTVSGATMQYGSGSVPTTLNSTALIP
jgi:hypothetical protein